MDDTSRHVPLLYDVQCLCIYVAAYLDAVNCLAFDTMMAVTFNADYNTMDNPKFRYVMECIEEANIRLSVVAQADGLTFRRLDRMLLPRSAAAGSRFAKFIRRVLHERLQGKSVASRDIFSFLQSCKDPETGEELTGAALGTETATFIVAGKILPLERPLVQHQNIA